MSFTDAGKEIMIQQVLQGHGLCVWKKMQHFQLSPDCFYHHFDSSKRFDVQPNQKGDSYVVSTEVSVYDTKCALFDSVRRKNSDLGQRDGTNNPIPVEFQREKLIDSVVEYK